MCIDGEIGSDDTVLANQMDPIFMDSDDNDVSHHGT